MGRAPIISNEDRVAIREHLSQISDRPRAADLLESFFKDRLTALRYRYPRQADYESKKRQLFYDDVGMLLLNEAGRKFGVDVVCVEEPGFCTYAVTYDEYWLASSQYKNHVYNVCKDRGFTVREAKGKASNRKACKAAV